ncbi:hypothetical protein Sar04_32970 [Salinispora arenicola]|uniref:Uncharacterized protein n=1 Tax=Salinispora arenicola TaxID=168697 RepID=A0A542XUK0_SALAC|nr:hypothetical protein FB564_4771 [Salinispora arenicola]GIM86561.1 hypothetical protein Sar04_32970 [Salinispora arenicola]
MGPPTFGFVAWIRRVRTASGATAVQIAEYVGGRRRIVAHVGSAHTEAELGLLISWARELLADPGQGEFELGVEPVARKAMLVGPAGDAALFDADGSAGRGRRWSPRRGWCRRRRGCCTRCWARCSRLWDSTPWVTGFSGTW